MKWVGIFQVGILRLGILPGGIFLEPLLMMSLKEHLYL